MQRYAQRFHDPRPCRKGETKGNHSQRQGNAQDERFALNKVETAEAPPKNTYASYECHKTADCTKRSKIGVVFGGHKEYVRHAIKAQSACHAQQNTAQEGFDLYKYRCFLRCGHIVSFL